MSREGPAGNEAYQNRRRERDKLTENQESADLRAVMSTPAGRRFVWHLITFRCGFFKRIPAGPEGLMQSGRRDLALGILDELLQVDALAHRQMWAEGWAAKDEEAIHARDAALVLAKQEFEE